MPMTCIASLPIRPSNAASSSNSCIRCAVRSRCLPGNMEDAGVGLVNRLVTQRVHLQRGEHLYRTGEAVRHRLYAIQSGQFKTYHLSSEGEQRIAGFQFAGDFLGLDSIGLSYYRNSTMALSDVVVCEFSHARLVEAAQHCEALAVHLRELLSKQLALAQTATLLLANRADQKLSGFLLALPARRADLEPGALVLELHMSRADIGAYLGLADTTVSRTLSRFRRRGYLALQHHQLTITDEAGLRAIASGNLP